MSEATTHHPEKPSPGVRLLVLAAVAAAAVAALATARAHPAGAFATRSLLGGTIEIAAAVGLAAAGVLAWEGGAREGLLLVCGGVAWLLAECSNPDIGVAVLFTLGLVGAFAPVPIVVYLALGRPPSAARRTAALVSCVGLAAVGLVPALVFDPRAQGCLTCPRNLLLVHGDASLYLDLSRWGIRVAIAATLLAALAILVAAARSSVRALVAFGPVLAAALLYLGVVVADLWHSASRAVLSNDQVDVALWRVQGMALVLFAVAVIRGVLRARRTRMAMAALVVEVGNAPRIGGARDKLAEALGDPTVELAYRRATVPGYVSIEGSPVAPPQGPGRAATIVTRDGQEIALVIHDERLLVEPRVVGETVAAARLAIENEQLQAELNAQASEIRASRLRIVRDGDRARRELERDLHDGAQQQLVTLSLAIRLLQGRAQTAATRDALDRADARLREALAELRDVAHGIYPAGLSDDGLAAAFEDLVERSTGQITLRGLPQGRFPAVVEEAAYFAVAEILDDLDEQEGPVSISVRPTEGRLDVEVHRNGPTACTADRVTEISDRIGALDGTVKIAESETGALDLRASIPCV